MKTHLNLLPPEFRIKICLRKKLYFWGGTFGLLMAMCATLCLWQYGRVLHLRAQVKKIEEQAKPVQSIVAKTAKLRVEHEAFLKKHAPVTALEQTQNPLQLLALIGSGTRTVHVHVQELTYQQVRGSTPPGEGEEAPATVTGGHLRLTGVARDDIAITNFVKTLRSHNVFQSVDLKSTAETTWNKQPARTYLVECAL